MTASARRLTLSLLLLLLPTIGVGWLGLHAITDLEQDLHLTLTTTVASSLRGTEQQLQNRLEATVAQFVSTVDGQPTEDVIQTLRKLTSASQSTVLAGLLLQADGQPLFPDAPLGRTAEPATAPQGPPGLLERLRQAEYLAQNNMVEEALEHLELTRIPADNPELSARIHLERALLLRKRKKPEPARALAELQLAEKALRPGPSPPARRMRGLWLQVLVVIAETRQQLAAAGSELAGPEAQRIEDILSTARDIAGGVFDAENDEMLDYLRGRLEAILAPRATDDIELQLRLEEIRQQNQDRIALRALLEDVLPLKIAEAEPSSGRPLTRLLGGRVGVSTLLTSRKIELTNDQDRQVCWLVLQLDVAGLFNTDIQLLQARLTRDIRQDYYVEVADLQARALVTAGEVPKPADAGQAEELAYRQWLRTPLHGLELVAMPSEPVTARSETRRLLVTKAILLLALAATAVAGAWLLVRTLRHEAELNSMKTDFVGRVSHELKTPLALIRMYGETLAMGRVDDHEKVEQFAGVIATQAHRLTRMIDNVLDFSRIEAGKKEYQPVATRLDLQLQAVLQSYQPHLEEQGFVLDWGKLPELTAVVDPEALNQAVLNLLSNAQKYTPEDSEKTIEVQLTRQDGMADIAVLDRGVGVPLAERERVFERFYRASTAGERRGAGLGLALVWHFIQAHAGRAVCDHRPGGGSVFRIQLPLAEEEVPPRRKQ